MNQVAGGALRVVGVADCQVSRVPDEALITYALGSCVGIAIHDPSAKVAGLLHYMLPESRLDVAKAEHNPYMFADTGIPLLFQRAYALGADKRRLVVRVAGGAQVVGGEDMFQIGKLNCLAMRKILWKAGVLIHGEAVGGKISRTLRLEVGTGRLWMRDEGWQEKEFPESMPLRKGGALGVPCTDCR